MTVFGLALLALGLAPIQARAGMVDQKLNGELHGVSAVSGTDVWAAGFYLDVGTDTNRTLIENWNGSAWSVVASPNVGSSNNYLYGVSALSASDAWAVGYHGAYHTLIERWNGSDWSVVPSPNVGSAFLYGVSAVSATDAWAVGTASDRTLIEHWNGSTWSIVASPNVGLSNNFLNGVSAVSDTAAWAVGSRVEEEGDYQHTLIERWKGSAWSVVASPDVGVENYLSGVSAASGSDVWAVGYADSETLIERWNGSAWSVVASPDVGYGGSLVGVSALSGTDAWAVGHYEDADTGTDDTLIEHWNGSAWSVMASPNVRESGNHLFGVSAVSGTDAWAVGNSYVGNQYTNGTLIERWNGTAWRIGDDVHPPTVTTPQYKLVQPSRLSGSSPPTIAETTIWSGDDLDDPIASYQAQAQVNGVWKNLSLSSPTATSVSTRLAVGSTYTFRVRATDSNGNTGSWASGPTDSVFGYQETAAAYAGTWTHASLSGAWGGSVDSTTAAGAAASFTFSGDHLAWIGTVGPSYGSAKVYINGSLWKTVNCNAPTTATREVLLKYGFGSVDTNTIKIVNVATPGHPRIDVDGFVTFG